MKFQVVGYLMFTVGIAIWKEWMETSNGVPFLEVPGNVLFMLNIDWFQPFERTQYSTGVIYLVIQNLPRSVRFKPENIIIVSAIPGPKEHTCAELNPYLEPLVRSLGMVYKCRHQVPFLVQGRLEQLLCISLPICLLQEKYVESYVWLFQVS